MLPSEPNKYERPLSGVTISMPVEVAEKKRMENIATGRRLGVEEILKLLYLFSQGSIPIKDIKNPCGSESDGCMYFELLIAKLNPAKKETFNGA